MNSLAGRLPSAIPDAAASDAAEAALASRGFFCVAAGAVGELHKLYFVGALDGRSDQWLMVELVLHWSAASAQATFRGDVAPHRLAPLADECAALLAPVLRTHFGPLY